MSDIEFKFGIKSIKNGESTKLCSILNMTPDKEYKSRLGEMEHIVMSTNEDRLKILDYIKHQDVICILCQESYYYG